MSSMSFNCIGNEIHLKITDSCSAIKMGDFPVGHFHEDEVKLDV